MTKLPEFALFSRDIIKSIDFYAKELGFTLESFERFKPVTGNSEAEFSFDCLDGRVRFVVTQTKCQNEEKNNYIFNSSRFSQPICVNLVSDLSYEKKFEDPDSNKWIFKYYPPDQWKESLKENKKRDISYLNKSERLILYTTEKRDMMSPMEFLDCLKLYKEFLNLRIPYRYSERSPWNKSKGFCIELKELSILNVEFFPDKSDFNIDIRFKADVEK